MSVKFIQRPPEIIGAYLSDNGVIAPTQRNQSFWINSDAKFLPIMNLVDIDQRAELRLADPVNTSNDIQTGTDHQNRHYAPKLNNRHRLDITAGDLLVGGVRMFLNFMDLPIAVKSRTNIPKLFKPLSNSQLDQYKGQFLVLSFHTFNTPTVIAEETGLANYFESLLIEERQKGVRGSTTVMMLEYLARTWKERKTEMNGVVHSNTIKLVMVHTFKAQDFLVDGKEGKEVYCAETGLLFRRDVNPVSVSAHPKLNDHVLANKQIVQSMRENGISCFIVDNQNRIGERFINFAGQIRPIPHVVDKDRLEGLYITSIDADKTVSVDKFVELEKIDEYPHVFRSQEEAQEGTDLRLQAQREHELTKLAMNNESLLLKQRYEEQLRQMGVESKRQQAEFDETLRKQELAHQEALRAMRLQEEGTKSKFAEDKWRFDVMGMERKHQYETAKYERDNTIETLKTVGSVAGLLAGGYVLYRQLSK